jgi:hypothetical protein
MLVFAALVPGLGFAHRALLSVRRHAFTAFTALVSGVSDKCGLLDLFDLRPTRSHDM